MKAIKRYTVDEILLHARETFAPLDCEPIWSRDHDRLGFLIQDEKARRGVRFVPIELSRLEQDFQLDQIFKGIRSQLLLKGFALPEYGKSSVIRPGANISLNAESANGA